MECGEMTRLDLHPYSVVFLFLPMGMVAEHLPGIREQLAPGSRIIMHEQVPLAPGLQPTRSTLLTAESALTVAHLWNTAGPA